MAGFDNDVMYAKNADFTQADNQNPTESNGLATNGQLWIGSTAVNAGSTHINVGSITSPDSSITFGYSSPNITATVAGGTTTVKTLTPDIGGSISPVAGNINVFGTLSGTAQVVETANSSGNLRVEDRTFYTPYVVDPSSTVGSKGTFTTIQSAINATVADGTSTGGNTATIAIRFGTTGTYTENLVMTASHINFIGIGDSLNGLTGTGITIDGNFTFSGGTSHAEFQNISLVASGGGVAIACAANLVRFNNCSVSTGGFTLASPGNIVAFESNFADSAVTGGNLIATECSFGLLTMTNGAVATLRNCSGLTATVANTSRITDYGGVNYTSVTGTSSGVSVFLGTNIANLNPTATCNVSGITGLSTANSDLIGSNVTTLMSPFLQGNILNRRTVAISATVLKTDYYIGVTSTAAARTITLPDTSSASLQPRLNQTFIIKDESLAAGTNNITITPNGGTIEGAASYAINTNGGSATIIFDGTNYFVI